MTQVSATRFAMQPRADVARSAFNVNFTHKTSIGASVIIPIYVDEVVPGDQVVGKMTALLRMATPVVPFMDNIEFDTHFFFVPYRILWSNWERFMGEQTGPTDTTQFLVPYVEFTGAGGFLVPGGLPDYFGIYHNGNAAAALRVSALPFRAYVKIWNDWFRDQDMSAVVTEQTGDGPDAEAQYGTCFGRMKRPDYFTTARPWPQKPINMSGPVFGPVAPGQNLVMRGPNQGGAPVTGIGFLNGTTTTVGPITAKEAGFRLEDYNPYFTDTNLRVRAGATDGEPDIKVLVNDIRTAVMVQRMLEINARGGTRYAEIIRAHFGVVSPDSRLQRPEYLGGGRTFVQISPVAQTSATGVAGTTTVLGEQAAIGTGVAQGHSWRGAFTEHGVVLGLASLRADLTYQQGVERFWFRRSQYDFYWPGLAHLGEQAILRREIYATGGSTNDNTVFGYQERWSEYKYKPARTSGYMRSGVANTLDVWHLGQSFAVAPTLNVNFITDTPPISRVSTVATLNSNLFILDAQFNMKWVRPMPVYSVPGLGARL